MFIVITVRGYGISQQSFRVWWRVAKGENFSNMEMSDLANTNSVVRNRTYVTR